MIKKLIVFLFVLLIILISKTNLAQASVDPDFNPNFIISDQEMLNWNSLTLSEIQYFLESKNSYLATYETLNAYGTMKTAAEIIYEAAAANYSHSCTSALRNNNPDISEEEIRNNCPNITTVNPKAIIVLIQRESSLITRSNPSQRILDQATGYGCPDSGGCDPRWIGFGKQVNAAALQLLSHYNNASSHVNKARVFDNRFGSIYNEPMLVVPQNRATAALYIYTPHVFDGNYNFWRIYQRYFPETTYNQIARYPNGSLLQVKDEPGVWLIQNNQKRPFLSWGALTSRYNPNRIIKVDKSELNAYIKGAPIKYPNYSLLRSPQGEIYLIVDDQKRRFATDEIFKHFGFHPDEIINASSIDLSYYQNGTDITASSTYVTGALLQDPNSGGVFYVVDGYKSPIPDRVILDKKFPNHTIYPATTEQLEKLITTQPYLFEDGNLLKSRTVSTVYLITNGQKRPFFSGRIFEELGYKWENIIEVSPQHLYLYPFGEMVTD